MTPALQITLAGLGTYLIRISAVVLSGRLRQPSARTEATLRLIGPAVLAAIVADRVLVRDGAVDLRWEWLAAVVVTAVVARRWRSPGVTVAVGMATVWVLTWVL